MATNGGPNGTAPNDPVEIAARFILIIAGVVIVVFGMFQVASVSRTTTHSETHYTATIDSTVASETRTSQDVKPDERPSDTALGIVFGVGAVLLIAGGYYNRKFAFEGPGGVKLQANIVQQLVARTMALASAHPRAADVTPEMVGSIVAESLTDYYYPSILGIRVARLRRGAQPPVPLDSVIKQKIGEALETNQPSSS
jgi:hypothetical protein